MRAMTEDQKKRLEELENKEFGGEKFAQGEWGELDRLRSIAESERADAIVRPMCCDAARRYPSIVFTVNYYDADSNTDDGKWSIAKNDYLTRHEQTKGDVIQYINNTPAPKFCPYCATPLPKMVRRNPMPEGVCRVTDGGYYCDTCKERLMGCKCLPLSAAFEPEHE